MTGSAAERPGADSGAGGAAPGRIVARLTDAGQTVAVAESLTGGLLCAALTSVPGSSAVVRGGVIAYALDVKSGVLGVDPDLLSRVGPVDSAVAAQMAAGVRSMLAATYGVATTGEAGPDSASGAAVGTVVVAVCGPVGTTLASIRAPGDRAEVRAAAVSAALDLLETAVG